MSESYPYEYQGAQLEKDLAEFGVNPLSLEERLAVVDATEVVFTPEEIDDQAKYLALRLVADELPYIKHAFDNDEEYVPFVPVVALNGGVVMSTTVFRYMSQYGVEVEPIFVNPSGYGTSQNIGDVKMNKGYTDEELRRMSGGRVVYFDEGNDTGNTRKKVKAITTELLNGETLQFQGAKELVKRAEAIEEIANLLKKLPGLFEGEDATILQKETDSFTETLYGFSPVTAGKVQVVQTSLEPTLSLKSAFMWDKDVDPNNGSDPIDYLAAKIPNVWEVGFGYDTALENGSSLGRNADFLAISRQQPEETEEHTDR